MNTTIRMWCENILNSTKRVAVPIMTHPGIELIGATVYEAVTNGEVHARAIKALYQHYQSAAVTMIMDLTVEAEAFGCQIKFEEDDIPTVTGKLIANMEEVARLRVPEPASSKRVREYLKAAELTIKEIRDIPVFPGCIGPFSLAGRLLDMTEIMTAIYLDPDLVQALLEKCAHFIEKYIKAYKLLGAAGIILAEPAAGLLGEEECNLFSSGYIKKMVDEFQDENFLIILHNCGHNGFLAGSMAATGARALHFGNAANMTLVLKEVPDDILVMGNLDPVNVLQTGDPEFVKQKTTALLEQTGNHPNFVLSSGCDLPPGVPQKNIQAFFEALDAYNVTSPNF